MSEWRIVKTETVVYRADPDELRRKYPEEWDEFRQHYGLNDRLWLDDCLGAGGVELFDEIDRDWEIDIYQAQPRKAGSS